LQRLATERGAGRWKWSLAGAAVAATLLIAAGGIAWYVQRPINVAQRDLPEFVIKDRSMDEKAVRDYLQTQGLIDAVPRPLNYQYLRDVEVIEFKGRRVAKLSFSRADEFCEAIVLVLPDRDFLTTRLEEDPTSLKVHPDETEPVTHVIMFRGSLHALMRPITAH
jgi:hypothetical protein